MLVEEFTEQTPSDEIVEKVAALALDPSQSSLVHLRTLLLLKFNLLGADHIAVPRLASRALIQKGKAGVEVLKNALLEASFAESALMVDIGTILEHIWFAKRGELPSKKFLGKIDLIDPLDSLPSAEAIEAARLAFLEIVEESQLNGDLLIKIVLSQIQIVMSAPEDEAEAAHFLRSVIYDLFTEPAIRITDGLIQQLERLISENHTEEIYQRFLATHPVFLDPLASQVIPKQRLGIELVTDFVLRRLDNQYVLVEIEKPQDALFTTGNDFTAKFTHGYGQVLGFQDWVESHSEYARTLLPEISTPKGLLVMGTRSNLSVEQSAKLKRLNINSKAIDVMTFDDIVANAKNLHENIHRQREQYSDYPSLSD